MVKKIKGILTEKEIGIIWRRWAGSKKPTPLLQAIDEVNYKCKKKFEKKIKQEITAFIRKLKKYLIKKYGRETASKFDTVKYMNNVLKDGRQKS